MTFGLFLNDDEIPLVQLPYETERWGLFWRKEIFEYRARQEKPLTYQGVGNFAGYWRPDNHFKTDFGSIPPPFWSLPGFSRTRFLRSYLFHDSAQIHGGLWKLEKDAWQFHDMTMLATDEMLRMMVGAEGANVFRRAAIYRGVRLASPFRKFPSGEKFR